jgi:hypothetical protein
MESPEVSIERISRNYVFFKRLALKYAAQVLLLF